MFYIGTLMAFSHQIHKVVWMSLELILRIIKIKPLTEKVFLSVYILFNISFLLGFSSCGRSEDFLLAKCPKGPSPHGGTIQRQPFPTPQIMCALLRYQQSAQCYFFLFSVHFLFNRNVSRNMNVYLSLPSKGVMKNLEKLNIPLSLHYPQFPFTQS